MPISRDRKNGKVVVTWPLKRSDFEDIYSGINQKTLLKLFGEIKIPKGRTLSPRECVGVFTEMGLPHADFDIRIPGIKVEIFQMDLGFD